jgi:hypothetical protein
MDLTFRSACIGISTVCLVGCGSSPTAGYADARSFDSGIPDATSGDADSAGTRPGPMSGLGNILVAGGPATLLQNGPPCTGEVGATGDRWCAFSSPSSSSIGNVNLFVVNVSQAASGVKITCGGGTVDRNCLKLTGGFFEEANAPVSHAALFQGDTLVYFDLTGTPYGWRAGMPNGRVLALDIVAGDIRNCLPARRGTAVFCVRDLVGSPTATETQSDVLAGRLDGPSDPPLRKVDTVISDNPADDLQRFQYGFPTSAGDFIAWSGRATPTGPSVLKVQNVDDDTSRRTVASDVFLWNTSPDGSQWYWLSQFGVRSGNLQTAPFLDGAQPTSLIADVADFDIAPTGAIVAITSMGVLQGIVDPIRAPTNIASIDTGVLGFLNISAQGHVAYARHYNSILDLVDLYVKNLDGTGARCALTTQMDGRRGTRFTPGSGAIVWARTDLDSPVGEPPSGLFTNLASCTTAVIGARVALVQPAGDTGIIFMDDLDRTDGTLRIRGVTGGNMLAPGAPVLIQTRVDSYFPLTSSRPALVYTVNAGSSTDGLYLHPISGGQVGTDGGTDAGTDGGASPPDAALDGSNGNEGGDAATDGLSGEDGSSSPDGLQD